MKKIIIVAAVLLMITSVAAASPLTDYSPGKTSIDLIMRDTTNSGTSNVVSGDATSKYNLDAAATFGLGNNLAFQFRTFSPESKNTDIIGYPGLTDKTKYTANEFNILYKTDKNFAFFIGLVNAKGQMTFSDPRLNFTTKTQNLWQFGAVESVPLGDQATAWASAAVGSSNLLNWEIGLGYTIAPNTELNLTYREFRADDFSGNLSDGTAVTVGEAKAKGLGFGVNFKF
jgi:hypothetical protein